MTMWGTGGQSFNPIPSYYGEYMQAPIMIQPLSYNNPPHSLPVSAYGRIDQQSEIPGMDWNKPYCDIVEIQPDKVDIQNIFPRSTNQAIPGLDIAVAEPNNESDMSLSPEIPQKQPSVNDHDSSSMDKLYMQCTQQEPLKEDNSQPPQQDESMDEADMLRAQLLKDMAQKKTKREIKEEKSQYDLKEKENVVTKNAFVAGVAMSQVKTSPESTKLDAVKNESSQATIKAREKAKGTQSCEKEEASLRKEAELRENLMKKMARDSLKKVAPQVKRVGFIVSICV